MREPPSIHNRPVDRLAVTHKNLAANGPFAPVGGAARGRATSVSWSTYAVMGVPFG
jgi:hypothetical protein